MGKGHCSWVSLCRRTSPVSLVPASAIGLTLRDISWLWLEAYFQTLFDTCSYSPDHMGTVHILYIHILYVYKTALYMQSSISGHEPLKVRLATTCCTHPHHDLIQISVPDLCRAGKAFGTALLHTVHCHLYPVLCRPRGTFKVNNI